MGWWGRVLSWLGTFESISTWSLQVTGLVLVLRVLCFLGNEQVKEQLSRKFSILMYKHLYPLAIPFLIYSFL